MWTSNLFTSYCTSCKYVKLLKTLTINLGPFLALLLYQFCCIEWNLLSCRFFLIVGVRVCDVIIFAAAPFPVHISRQFRGYVVALKYLFDFVWTNVIYNTTRRNWCKGSIHKIFFSCLNRLVGLRTTKVLIRHWAVNKKSTDEN